MSLPSPISIGDAIALSNIAFQIAKAFLPGSTNAENEFKELHKLLCSLTDSLRLVGETFNIRPKAADQGDGEHSSIYRANTVPVITETLSHCNDLLGDFARFIETYSTLKRASGPSSNSLSQSNSYWPGYMRRAWIKIQWAAEADNISGLKTSVKAQIQMLNLAISTANRLVIL